MIELFANLRVPKSSACDDAAGECDMVPTRAVPFKTSPSRPVGLPVTVPGAVTVPAAQRDVLSRHR